MSSSIRLSRMLSSSARPFLAIPAPQARLYSELASATSSAAVRPAPSDPLPPTTPYHPISQATVDLPYLVRRNTKGSIPVYTDIRNGGTKYLVLIRNVEGNVNVRFNSQFFSSRYATRANSPLFLCHLVSNPSARDIVSSSSCDAQNATDATCNLPRSTASAAPPAPSSLS